MHIHFSGFWKSTVGFEINELPIVRDNEHIFLRIWEIQFSILDYTVLIVRDFTFVFLRLWEIQSRILNNAISSVRNSAYIFYSFRKSSLGFSIIKLPIVRDYVRLLHT
jgi:hypothetical protein